MAQHAEGSKLPVDLSSNTVLVTGGATGIGLALAERFLQGGSRVIICGRREDRLRDAARRHPSLHVHVCDVESAPERVALRDWAVTKYPDLNVLVNNAGIQRRTGLTDNAWEGVHQEIAINLEAPIHLALLFAPHLAGRRDAAIVNITSGLAFVPLVIAPVYSATKAALHSFTLSLRHQLASTPVRVVEIIPPPVDTDLGGPGLHTFGVPVNEFADAVMARLGQGDVEIAYGMAEKVSQASRTELDEAFRRMNG
jgi:uncharacterized oxidoreductase